MMVAILRGLAVPRGLMRDETVVVLAFATTLFMSALLLFSIQPLFAKMILPKLGGAPAVWAVSMCFFQGALLAGYTYAFMLNRWLDDGRAIAVHLALMACTCIALPIGLPAAFPEPPTGEAYLWLMGLLCAGVGLPFFTVAANAPLLQAWFTRTGNRHAADPYFLYAASNLGSLVALLSYPLLVEPSLGLKLQSSVWTCGFLLLAGLIATAGVLRLANGASTGTAFSVRHAPPVCRHLGWRERFIWIGLAFVPSGLVVAVTTYITTDVASAPFLWVIPLALFLLSFVLVFRKELPFNYKWAYESLPAFALVMLLTQTMLISSVFALAAFMLAALVCHRELYNRRPGNEQLTEFYLLMSLGGVLGGIFSALIAPRIFTAVFELPLLTLLALLCRPGVLFEVENFSWKRIGAIMASGCALMGVYKLAVHAGVLAPNRIYLFSLVGLLCLGLFAIRRLPEHRAAMVLTMIAAASLSPADLFTVYVERSFFGTHRVLDSEDGAVRTLLHGTTVHGAERLRDEQGSKVSAAAPATYYHATGPMARGVGVARAALAAAGKPLAAGIIGLGTGSLSCYAQKGEAWRYFEIDPVVARIAADPKLFSFLSRCMPHSDIVIGDARLTLAREPSARFGYLVIDAFSSDSIPVHLLTAEAIQLFVSKLDPDGVIAIHVSNRHLDLVPALASTIALVPDMMAQYVDDERRFNGLDASVSQVVFLTRDAEVAKTILAWPDAKPLVAGTTRAWTDDYSNVLSALVRRLWGPT
jgi:hypothetical protein